MTEDVHSVDTPDGITYPDGEVTDAQAAVAAIDWDQRLRDAVAATLAARKKRRNERVILAVNRNWGLQQRHARKLNRGAESRSDAVSSQCHTATDTQLTDSSPVGETGTSSPSEPSGSQQ